MEETGCRRPYHSATGLEQIPLAESSGDDKITGGPYPSRETLLKYRTIHFALQPRIRRIPDSTRPSITSGAVSAANSQFG